MNTPEVYAALRERFAPPEWAIFFEVANGTGSHGRRYADAVAMNLYPSRGLEVHGFEVKVSRSDWHRELVNPAKAEDVYRFCDRWWLVVGDAKIVKQGELPSTWGLIVPRGSALAIVTQAPKLEPQPLSRPFFAALTRRAASVPHEEMEAIVRKRVEEEVARQRPHDRYLLERDRKELDDLRKKVQAFEEASGLSIGNNWSHKPYDVGKVVRFVLDGGFRSAEHELAMLERRLAAVGDAVRAARESAEHGVSAVQASPVGQS